MLEKWLLSKTLKDRDALRCTYESQGGETAMSSGIQIHNYSSCSSDVTSKFLVGNGICVQHLEENYRKASKYRCNQQKGIMKDFKVY